MSNPFWISPPYPPTGCEAFYGAAQVHVSALAG